MAIEIVNQQPDEVVLTRWHFKIGGPDSIDSTYRLADLTRDGITSPADWLAANGAEAQALIDAGYVSDEVNERRDFGATIDQINAEIDYLNTTIPAIDTMTAAQVRDVVKRLAQENREILKALRWVARRLN